MTLEKDNDMTEKAEALLARRGGKPLRILVVDDEENVRNVLVDICRTSKLFSVTAASGGQEAVERACQGDIDIVTIDLIMPDMSGLEAIEKIKKEKPHLPVVIVSGNATESLIRKAGQIGGCRVLYKPVEIDQFLDELIDLAEEKGLS
jgi:CheY-like chemotaxis protein